MHARSSDIRTARLQYTSIDPSNGIFDRVRKDRRVRRRYPIRRFDRIQKSIWNQIKGGGTGAYIGHNKSIQKVRMVYIDHDGRMERQYERQGSKWEYSRACTGLSLIYSSSLINMHQFTACMHFNLFECYDTMQIEYYISNPSNFKMKVYTCWIEVYIYLYTHFPINYFLFCAHELWLHSIDIYIYRTSDILYVLYKSLYNYKRTRIYISPIPLFSIY